MVDAAKKTTEDLATDFETIRSDIAALKRDLAMLITHTKGNAASGVVDEAQRLYDTVVAEGERSAAAIGRHIEERPVVSLLVAFGLGFIGGRLIAR